MKTQDSYSSIANKTVGEYSEKGSKFYAYASPVKTADEAENYVEAVQKEHFKARHHCYAYRIGISDDIFRMNDDGEPSGTAGKPIMGQIRSADLRDIVVVVVRYFGGTLLGVSGLIRAYKTAAARAIENTQKVKIHLRKLVEVSVEYQKEPFFMDALSYLDIDVIKRDYGKKAIITIAVPRSQAYSYLKRICAHILDRKAADIRDPYACMDEITFEILETEKS